MAEQIINVISGFYNAVSSDRTYSAEDMTRPYRRLVSDGVFATNEGTPSTDLRVRSGSGMVINVDPGQGIFAHKWFENPAVQSITVDANATLYTRIDSVIVQIDNSISGRVGSIVYRPGTPSATPEPPAISSDPDIVEFRIANITVAPSASVITTANITDLRGSASCPWVTALIQQVDTSLLYDQWYDAYSRYYDESTQAWDDYEAARKAEWNAFFDELTADLTLTTNVERLSSTYTTPAETTTIPVGIASYDDSRDILLVFINGILVQGSGWYSYIAGTNSIELVNKLPANQTVDFVVLKSVITGDISSVATQIQDIETALAAATNDSGWSDVALQNGAEEFSTDYTPQIRKIGKTAFLRGAVKGLSAAGTVFATLPALLRPSAIQTFTTSAVSGTTVVRTAVIQIMTDGQVVLTALSGAISDAYMIPLDFTYSV